MLEVTNLCAGYGRGDVLHDIGFTVKRGERLCIVGPNGCGKSTLLKSIARIIDYRGKVTLEGQDTASFSRRDLAKKTALLGQSAQVFFPYTVYETVSLGRYAWSEGFLKNLSAADTAVIDNVIDKLDLREIKNRMIDELSGGQLQRVFLARTLAQNPELILLDEPTNHLDLKNQIELLDFLGAWVREQNKTLIGVFHDLNLARSFGDTAILMDRGRIVSQGKAYSALNDSVLEQVYGMDIGRFMRESLSRWNATDGDR